MIDEMRLPIAESTVRAASLLQVVSRLTSGAVIVRPNNDGSDWRSVARECAASRGGPDVRIASDGGDRG